MWQEDLYEDIVNGLDQLTTAQTWASTIYGMAQASNTKLDEDTKRKLAKLIGLLDQIIAKGNYALEEAAKLLPEGAKRYGHD